MSRRGRMKLLEEKIGSFVLRARSLSRRFRLLMVLLSPDPQHLWRPSSLMLCHLSKPRLLVSRWKTTDPTTAANLPASPRPLARLNSILILDVKTPRPPLPRIRPDSESRTKKPSLGLLRICSEVATWRTRWREKDRSRRFLNPILLLPCLTLPPPRARPTPILPFPLHPKSSTPSLQPSTHPPPSRTPLLPFTSPPPSPPRPLEASLFPPKTAPPSTQP